MPLHVYALFVQKNNFFPLIFFLNISVMLSSLLLRGITVTLKKYWHKVLFFVFLTISFSGRTQVFKQVLGHLFFIIVWTALGIATAKDEDLYSNKKEYLWMILGVQFFCF